MKAKRLLLTALLSVVGCMFVFAGCNEEAKNHEHEYDWTTVTPATCTQEGVREGVCKICKQKTTEKIERAPHTFVGEPEVITPSTCTTKGRGKQLCSVCNTEQPVELELAPHDLEHYDAVTASCMKDGNIEYWHCKACGRDFTDSEGKNQAATTLILKEDVPHDYNEKGICNVCGERDPNAPHFCSPTKVDKVESDCKTQGIDEHYKCEECGKLYRDAEATQEVTEQDLLLELSTDHKAAINAIYHPAVPAKDCATFGKKERYDCKVCGRHFKTAELKEEDELIEVTEDDEVGDNTLQTPKSKVHAKCDAHAESEPNCTNVGWKKACVVCSICGTAFLKEEFSETTNSIKPMIGTFEYTNSDGEKLTIVADVLFKKDLSDDYYTKWVGNDYKVELKKNEDGSIYIPAPVDLESLTIPVNPTKHCEDPTKHIKFNFTGCGQKNVGYTQDCYECTLCHKLFDSKSCKTEVNMDEIYSYGNHGTMEHSNPTESTCMTHGHPEHWTCKACGEHFGTATPAADTAPLSDEEYNLPLAPHSFTEMKKNSKGHWNYCGVEGCGQVETDEDGATLIEAHVYEDDDDATCTVCGYGDVNFIEFFDYEYDDDTDPTYCIITGLKKDNEGKYFIANSDETVLQFPEEDNMEIPVTHIGASALSGNAHMDYAKALSKITEIYIPNTITVVGSNAFNWWNGNIQYVDIQLIEFESGTEPVTFEGDSTFCYFTTLKKIILPKYTVSLTTGMFYCCSELEEIVMPEKITGEGTHTLSRTFEFCTSLTEVDLWCYEDTRYSFSALTFDNCTNLKTLYLPKGLTQLGTACMSMCTSFEHFYYGGDQNDWQLVIKITGNLVAWNWNTYVLTQDLVESGILVFGYTPGAEL